MVMLKDLNMQVFFEQPWLRTNTVIMNSCKASATEASVLRGLTYNL